MVILDYLKEVRKKSKTTLQELSEELKINPITLARYEKGKREIPANLLIKYAEHFGFEIRLLKK